VNPWIAIAGLAAGLGLFLAVRELAPAPVRLDAALGRLEAGTAARPAGPLARTMTERLAAMTPWLPIPSADLALLGRDRDAWLATKVGCGLLGLALPALLAGLLALVGAGLPPAIPAATALAFGAALFFAPDLAVRSSAAERRMEFRHALTSYLDLVALERGAGAGPTDALEAAAEIGTGWAFERIGAALEHARQAGSTPWAGLAELAALTGIPELADLADIAGLAGNEGARILATLMSRAESMRAEALAAGRAKATARTTTMAIPVALLAAGFVLLLIFPDFYRLFVAR
jgi:Flp pilus assembly protein TadB